MKAGPACGIARHSRVPRARYHYGHPSAAAIRAELRRRLRQASVSLEGGRAYSVASFATFVAGWRALLQWMKAPHEGPLANRLSGEGLPVAEAFFKRCVNEALLNLIAEVRAGIAQHARLDRQLITFSLGWQDTADGAVPEPSQGVIVLVSTLALLRRRKR